MLISHGTLDIINFAVCFVYFSYAMLESKCSGWSQRRIKWRALDASWNNRFKKASYHSKEMKTWKLPFWTATSNIFITTKMAIMWPYLFNLWSNRFLEKEFGNVLVFRAVDLQFIFRWYFKGSQFKECVNAKKLVAAVTGCSCGIGKQIVRELNLRGAKVYMLCRNEERGKKAAFDLIRVSIDPFAVSYYIIAVFLNWERTNFITIMTGVRKNHYYWQWCFSYCRCFKPYCWCLLIHESFGLVRLYQ